MPAIQPIPSNATGTMDNDPGLGIIIGTVVGTFEIITLLAIIIGISYCVSTRRKARKEKVKTDTESANISAEDQSEQWRRQALGEAAQRIEVPNSVVVDHATRRYEQFVGANAGWTKKVGWDKDGVELQDLKKNGVVNGADVEEERGESSGRRDSLSLSVEGDIGGHRIEEGWTNV